MSLNSQQTAFGGGSTKVRQLTSEQAAAYWRANLTIIGILLTIWFVVSFVTSYLLAGVLNTISIGSVPLSFWMAQQGGILIYVILMYLLKDPGRNRPARNGIPAFAYTDRHTQMTQGSARCWTTSI